MKPGDIALIAHRDLDEVAALSLVEKKVSAIINIEETISGRYPNQGPSILLDANIPMFETENQDIFKIIREGDMIEIVDNSIIYKDKTIGDCKLLDEESVNELLEIGYKNLEKELENFIEKPMNMQKEKGLVTAKFHT